MKISKIINSIKRLYENLDKKRKFLLFIIIFFNILNGLIESISLASALLFLESLTDPGSISSGFKHFFIINSSLTNKEIIFFSTFIFIGISLISTSIRIFNLWLNMKFRISYLKYISRRAYTNIIFQNYEFHINSNSSELLTDMTSNIEKSNYFLENLLTVITSFFISFSIIISLFSLNFKITIYSVLTLSLLYTILGIFINKKVDEFSNIELKSNYTLIKNIQQSFYAIKEIILSNNFEFFIENFSLNNLRLRKYQGYSGFITTFPRYLFEGIGLLFLGILGYLIFINSGSNSNIIPILGTFALGAQKLLPSMQSIYKSWSLLFFYNKGLKRILEILGLKIYPYKNTKDKLKFNKKIDIKNISHSYTKNTKLNLSKINFSIQKGEHIGIFGTTGSGKTTFINILMGLIKPTNGKILIDDRELFESGNKTISLWRNNIDHIPQDIFLYDGSILENIAFCIPPDQVNFEKVKLSAKLACLEKFIETSKNGYNTQVGELGIKLSGGQKQRLGIARALYRNSSLLILDESTSALDQKTEKKIISNIFSKSNKSLTTITIAHRLIALTFCDKVIEIEEGKIKRILDSKDFNKELKMGLISESKGPSGK